MVCALVHDAFSKRIRHLHRWRRTAQIQAYGKEALVMFQVIPSLSDVHDCYYSYGPNTLLITFWNKLRKYHRQCFRPANMGVSDSQLHIIGLLRRYGGFVLLHGILLP